MKKRFCRGIGPVTKRKPGEEKGMAGKGVGEKGYRQTTIMHGDKHREKFARKAKCVCVGHMMGKRPGRCLRNAKRELAVKRRNDRRNKERKRAVFIWKWIENRRKKHKNRSGQRKWNKAGIEKSGTGMSYLYFMKNEGRWACYFTG